jgi:cation diffusion facilitator CzcD-associated flavoprotein CzcO
VRRSAETPFLIVGAGPFGLAMAAEAAEIGVPHVVLGEPMSFWREHMPAGMVLRSACDWHLDPAGRATMASFLAERGQAPADVEPLPLALYLEYAEWFVRTKAIRPLPRRVVRLDRRGETFEAALDDGSVLRAGRVLLALGFAPFAHVPDELAALVPPEASSHTRDCDRPNRFAGRRVLIVGGRQSAYETAALLAEAGADAVHVCHRHEAPAFAPSDWEWIGPLLDRFADEPAWFRSLTEPERQEIDRRLWAEGRLKLEPWLGPRVAREEISVHPRACVAAATRSDGHLRVRLDTGEEIAADHVLYATGYRVDLRRVPFLAAGNLLSAIELREGSPVLDPSLQSTVPGLYFTSLPAARDFGPFFGFTVSVRASAQIVGKAIRPR